MVLDGIGDLDRAAADFAVFYVGLAADGEVQDHRNFLATVRAGESVFHLDWTNLQQPVSVPACATSFTANVGKATSDGFDLAVNAQATNHIKIGSDIGYANARIAQTAGIPGGVVFVAKGDQIDPYHAPWTVTGNIEYDLTLAGNPAYARVDDEFRSRNPGPFTFQNPNSISYNTNSGINPSTNLLNFRLGTIVHGWDIAGFAKNLLNTQPELFVIAASDPIAPHGHAYTETPRTIGVTTSYRW